MITKRGDSIYTLEEYVALQPAHIARQDPWQVFLDLVYQVLETQHGAISYSNLVHKIAEDTNIRHEYLQHNVSVALEEFKHLGQVQCAPGGYVLNPNLAYDNQVTTFRTA